MVVQAYNKAIQQGQKTVGFAPASLILTNYFLPVNWALVGSAY